MVPSKIGKHPNTDVRVRILQRQDVVEFGRDLRESVGDTPAKENDVSSARSVGATRGSTLSTTLSKDVSTPPSEPRFETPTPPEATAAVDLDSAAPILSAFVGVLTQIKERAVPTAFAMLKAGQGL